MATFYKCTFNGNTGTGVSPAVAYFTRTSYSSGYVQYEWYTTQNSGYQYALSFVDVPVRECFSFNGYWTAKSGGVQVVSANGGFFGSVYGGPTSAFTAYAQWIRKSWKFTLDRQGGSGGTAAIYSKWGEGGWYSDDQASAPSYAIAPPTRPGHIFRGYFTAAAGSGTKWVNEDGTFTLDMQGAVPGANATLYAFWEEVRTVTVNANGGVGGAAAFYYGTVAAAFYADAGLTEPIVQLALPVKASSILAGIYDSDSASGTLVVDVDGTIVDDWAPPDSCTVYAQWLSVHGVILDGQQGVGGTSELVYDPTSGQYRVLGTTEAATVIEIPVRECYRFLGYYSTATGGTKYIDSDGTLLSALTSLVPTADMTIYAQWELCSHKLTFDPGEGTAGMLSIYCDGSENRYYADDQLVTEITSVAVPVLAGHDFGGYGDDVDSSGAIIRTLPFTADGTSSAVWTPKTYSIFFIYGIGSGSVSAKTATWGEPIGTLPTAIPPAGSEYTFEGWSLGGRAVTASTVWDYDAPGGAANLVAEWTDPTMQITDYFGLSGPLLVCIASSDGATRTVVETGPGGKLDIKPGDSSVGAHRVYGKIMNPTNTYRVIGRGSVLLTMGRAYGMATLAASITEGGVRHPVVTQSGYMLVGWKLKTAPDAVPLLEVVGMGNEGYKCASSGQTATAQLTPAINTYGVQVPLDPDHIAQDPFSVVDGGGELVSCVTEGRCDAVVPMEYGMPCASDICHGKIVVSAQTAAYNGEPAPAARTPFVEVQPAESREENDYTICGLVAERSL